MELELMKEFRFEASHMLPKHPGKCSRLHGHSWVLRVYVQGEVDPETGFVMDYTQLKDIVQKSVIDKLDHRHLGVWAFEGYIESEWKVPGLPINFYPSSENLIIWIGTQLSDYIGTNWWSKLELDETCTSRCTLTREAYNGDSTTRYGRNIVEKA